LTTTDPIVALFCEHREEDRFSVHLHLELAFFAITSACVLLLGGNCMLMVGLLLGDEKGPSEIGVTV